MKSNIQTACNDISKYIKDNLSYLTSPAILSLGYSPLKKAICSGPATTLFFEDGSKETVKIASYLNRIYEDDRVLAVYYCILKRYCHAPWKKKLEDFTNDLMKMGEYSNIYIEKAFVASLIRDMHEPYISQAHELLHKPALIVAKQKGTCFYRKRG